MHARGGARVSQTQESAFETSSPAASGVSTTRSGSFIALLCASSRSGPASSLTARNAGLLLRGKLPVTQRQRHVFRSWSAPPSASPTRRLGAALINCFAGLHNALNFRFAESPPINAKFIQFAMELLAIRRSPELKVRLWVVQIRRTNIPLRPPDCR